MKRKYAPAVGDRVLIPAIPEQDAKEERGLVVSVAHKTEIAEVLVDIKYITHRKDSGLRYVVFNEMQPEPATEATAQHE